MKEGASAEPPSFLGRRYPQVPGPPPRPPPVQVRPVSQVPSEQHGLVLAPQGSQTRPASAVPQTSLLAVQKAPPPPRPPAQHGSPGPPQEPPSPTHAPA